MTVDQWEISECFCTYPILNRRSRPNGNSERAYRELGPYGYDTDTLLLVWLSTTDSAPDKFREWAFERGEFLYWKLLRILAFRIQPVEAVLTLLALLSLERLCPSGPDTCFASIKFPYGPIEDSCYSVARVIKDRVPGVQRVQHVLRLLMIVLERYGPKVNSRNRFSDLYWEARFFPLRDHDETCLGFSTLLRDSAFLATPLSRSAVEMEALSGSPQMTVSPVTMISESPQDIPELSTLEVCSDLGAARDSSRMLQTLILEDEEDWVPIERVCKEM